MVPLTRQRVSRTDRVCAPEDDEERACELPPFAGIVRIRCLGVADPKVGLSAFRLPLRLAGEHDSATP